MIRTACPLDCYDACAISVDRDKPHRLIATDDHPTSNGALCPLLNKYIHEVPRILKPKVDGVEVEMCKALDAVADRLKSEDTLLWRGSGNLGVMQNITNILIEKLKGTLTKGSLCDGAGQAGILEGRGHNYQLPPEQIAKADVVVVWGRNITVTNSHLMPYIKGKKLIVIDPISTTIAKKADIHIQLRPRSDFYLAIMLARFAYMQNAEDEEWLDEYASEYEEFYEFTQSFRVKSSLEHIGIDLHAMGEVLDLIVGKKVVFILGTGPQKYSTGHYTFWAIDSLATTLGLFGREGCGVSYLGLSSQGFDSPFAVEVDRAYAVNTAFDTFDTVIVQGGNPAASMPNSADVIEALGKVKNLIYFGLYENETSHRADIIIPGKNFLEKDDIRLSYGHQYISDMNKVLDSTVGISEYEFTKEILTRLEMDTLLKESEYLELWRSQYDSHDGVSVLPDYLETPYESGFGADGDDEFVFVDDYNDDMENPLSTEDGEYWLLTPKSNKSLNTQFVRNNKVMLPVSSGFDDGDEVEVSSQYGRHKFAVKISDDLRYDSAVIVSGSIGLNYLTPAILSQKGESACYQDTKVKVAKA